MMVLCRAMSQAAILAVVLVVGCGSSGSKPDRAIVELPDTATPTPDVGQMLDAAAAEAPPLDATFPDLAGDTGLTGDSAADLGAADATADTTAADAAADAAPDLPPPMPVTLQFTGTVATVAGTPLGLDSTARTAAITGSFTYDLRTPDALPGDPKRGRYLHGTTSGFTFTVLGHTIEGSGYAIVQTENLDPDTFRFLDGPDLDPVPRIMKVDGAAARDLKLFIAISSDSATFLGSDALPSPFPTIDITHTPHTFSLSDKVADKGGTLLMQLTTLTQK